MSTLAAPPRNPFIAGSWVRGEDFFGRGELVREVLEGERHSLWVLGGRRLGKTSLLKELEFRVQRSRETPFVPLYWDLQGSGDARGLAETLLASVEDSEAFRRATDVLVEDLESQPVADMLASLVRRTVRSGWRLLLLVDEAEELLVVGRADAAVLRAAAARAVARQRGAHRDHGHAPAGARRRAGGAADLAVPAGLHPARLPDAAHARRGPGAPRARRLRRPDADTVLERAACHPFLVQLIASRLFESRDLAVTLDQLAADEMVANYFAVDFGTLEPVERRRAQRGGPRGNPHARELARKLGRTRGATSTRRSTACRCSATWRATARPTASPTGSSSAGCGGG